MFWSCCFRWLVTTSGRTYLRRVVRTANLPNINSNHSKPSENTITTRISLLNQGSLSHANVHWRRRSISQHSGVAPTAFERYSGTVDSMVAMAKSNFASTLHALALFFTTYCTLSIVFSRYIFVHQNIMEFHETL
jgi:hypothetical protein